MKFILKKKQKDFWWVQHFWWVLNLAFSLTGWDTLEAPRAPAQYSGSSAAFFTRTRAAGFMRARQTDPLDAVKPSTSEQRGQVLGGFIEGSPAPSRGKSLRPASERPLHSPISTHGAPTDGGRRVCADGRRCSADAVHDAPFKLRLLSDF